MRNEILVILVWLVLGLIGFKITKKVVRLLLLIVAIAFVIFMIQGGYLCVSI